MKILIKFAALLFVINMLTGCEPPEPTMFGIPQSQWYTLTKAQQKQVIEGYNRQQEINAQNAQNVPPPEETIAVGATIVADDDYYNSYEYRHDYYRRHGYYPPWHHDDYDHHRHHDHHDYHPEPQPPRPGPGPIPPRPVPPQPTPQPYSMPQPHGHGHEHSIPVISPDKSHHSKSAADLMAEMEKKSHHSKSDSSDFNSFMSDIKH
jgi:hypothetical protein